MTHTEPKQKWGVILAVVVCISLVAWMISISTTVAQQTATRQASPPKAGPTKNAQLQSQKQLTNKSEQSEISDALCSLNSCAVFPKRDQEYPKIAAPIWNGEVQNAPPVGTLYKPSKSAERIAAALVNETVVSFIDTPLGDVVSYLSDLHQIPIQIDEEALQGEALDKTDPITIDKSGVKLKSVLNLILDPLNLTYVVENETLLITSQARSIEKLETQVYEIRKLTLAGMKPDQLISTIMHETTGLWLNLDGAGGTISAVPGGLVVKQSQQMHREILAMLKQLELLVENGQAQSRPQSHPAKR